jgi:hypothetical protein
MSPLLYPLNHSQLNYSRGSRFFGIESISPFLETPLHFDHLKLGGGFERGQKYDRKNLEISGGFIGFYFQHGVRVFRGGRPPA